jgi:predicted enzyme related to lactoylglutathione lyase
MQQREGFPPGVPAWIDRLVPDPHGLAAFYGGLFGWTFEELEVPAQDAPYLVALLGGRRAVAISSPRLSTPGDAWNTYIGCDDVEATIARVREAGGTVVAEPIELGDAAVIATCVDPAGATFGLWQPRSIGGAEVVNAPGSWNFSELNATDVDGANRFYGAVFGWVVDAVDLGTGDPSLMVRLPGYADFLEQFDPGIRERHASFGAPPGFSECIAWIVPLPEGEAPHWSVTFTVADADATVARARELGGVVEVEPFDVGPTRSSVIRDPAGARFAANAFNPG